jgi:hypothetical protein
MTRPSYSTYVSRIACWIVVVGRFLGLWPRRPKGSRLVGVRPLARRNYCLKKLIQLVADLSDARICASAAGRILKVWVG